MEENGWQSSDLPKISKDNLFQKHNRIRKSSDFQRVIEKGKAVVSPLFVILFLPNGYSFSRLGISVRRKFGKAVHRNHIKRWIREVFRLDIQPMISGYDLVIIPRKKMADNKGSIPFNEVRQQIGKMVDQFKQNPLL